MRNIAEIIKDDKNGKQLSQTERQIATAYIQGKYDAAMELIIGNNSNTNEVFDKIKEIVNKWRLDIWTDNRSYECMVKIAELVESPAERDLDRADKISKSIPGTIETQSIPFLMHKEMGIPISECQKAYDAAIDYLRNKAKIKG